MVEGFVRVPIAEVSSMCEMLDTAVRQAVQWIVTDWYAQQHPKYLKSWWCRFLAWRGVTPPTLEEYRAWYDDGSWAKSFHIPYVRGVWWMHCRVEELFKALHVASKYDTHALLPFEDIGRLRRWVSELGSAGTVEASVAAAKKYLDEGYYR
jgi:hypothetical protein